MSRVSGQGQLAHVSDLSFLSPLHCHLPSFQNYCLGFCKDFNWQATMPLGFCRNSLKLDLAYFPLSVLWLAPPCNVLSAVLSLGTCSQLSLPASSVISPQLIHVSVPSDSVFSLCPPALTCSWWRVLWDRRWSGEVWWYQDWKRERGLGCQEA